MVLVCHVILQDHLIKAYYDFVLESLPKYVTILPNVVAIGTLVEEI